MQTLVVVHFMILSMIHSHSMFILDFYFLIFASLCLKWPHHLYLVFVYIFPNFIKRVTKHEKYKKKVQISTLLPMELNFTFTQKQRLKNSKKKGNKLKMAAEVLAIVNLTLCTFFETL